MPKILIADDSLFMRKLIGKILTDRGHTVIGEANNGKDAVEKYAKLRPDLVTMDIVMPGMNGLAALKKIIQLDPQAKVIMVTALGQEPLAIEAVKNGASEFVVKPFKVDQVAKAVEKVLSL
ncbi:MAG: response regulator [Candidatus Hodarchaeales archaeon]|jgi:two-component system chemotaxis response regulator CheY